MKHLISCLLLFASVFCNGQDLQNNNWFYGMSLGVDFTDMPNISELQYPFMTNPLSLQDPNPNYLEGNATLSDLNGNLIMFSDGVRLWGRNPNTSTFKLITNQLKGLSSSASNVLFIPRPGNPSRYYVVTINGATAYGDDAMNHNNEKGLFYSEVDISTNSLVPGTINKPLRYYSEPMNVNSDEIVDESYQNLSESITSALHANGTDYWLLAHVQPGPDSKAKKPVGFFLSFKVDCNGIGTANNNGFATKVQEFNLDTEVIGYFLKVAPEEIDNKGIYRLAFSTPDFVRHGTFDANTGEMDLPNTIQALGYGIDFSPSGNVLFYSEQQFDYGLVRALDLTTHTLTSFDAHYMQVAIQRARNGRVYVASYGPLQEIVNPEDVNNLGEVDHEEYVTSGGLSQWVYWQEADEKSIIQVANDEFYNDSCEHWVSPTTVLEKNPNDNDTYNGVPITSLTGYTLHVVGYASPMPTAGGVSIDLTTGHVIVEDGTPNGTYTLLYQICQTGGCLCSNIATVKVIVEGKKGKVEYDLPREICYGDKNPPILPTTIEGVSGVWEPSEVSVTESGCYIFIPDDPCIAAFEACITGIPQKIPIFSPVPTSICEGGSFPNMPEISQNNIVGSWTGWYNHQNNIWCNIFFPKDDQCAKEAMVCITVVPNITPTFPGIPTTICDSEPSPVLPTQSVEGITGTWSANWYTNGLFNCKTFTPDPGQCATTTEFCFAVMLGQTPTFSGIPETVCEGQMPTLPTVSNEGITGSWALLNQVENCFTYQFTSAQPCVENVTATICEIESGSLQFPPIDTTICETEQPVLPQPVNGEPGAWQSAGNNCYVYEAVNICIEPYEVCFTIVPLAEPTFDFPAEICEDDDFPTLPATSLNGFSGTWGNGWTESGNFICADFTPDQGECAVPVEVCIEVTPKETPFFWILPFSMCENLDPVAVLPTQSTQGINGWWECSDVIDGGWSCVFHAQGCAEDFSISIIAEEAVEATFDDLPEQVCLGSIAQHLLPDPNPPIPGYWDSQEIDTQVAGTFTYTFWPEGECVNPTVIDIDVVPDNYTGVVVNEYLDGYLSSNTAGIEFANNFPAGTTYGWTVYRQSGSVQHYPPTTDIIRMVATSFTNRIVSVVVHVFYNDGCQRDFEHEFICPIPHQDTDGVMFPDCPYYGRPAQQQLKGNVTVHPNPTSSFVHFEGAASGSIVKLYDCSGKVLADEKLVGGLDLSSYQAGLYFYEISQNGTVFQRGKIIKE